MTLKSALEDVLGTTLAAVVGLIGKLDYVANLRVSGKYSHWGLSKVYGEPATQEAIAEAHRLMFLNVLRTSLRTLHDDLRVSSEAAQLPPRDYANLLRSKLDALLPQNLSGGSARHLSSVLHALSSLASTPKPPQRAIPPA